MPADADLPFDRAHTWPRRLAAFAAGLVATTLLLHGAQRAPEVWAAFRSARASTGPITVSATREPSPTPRTTLAPAGTGASAPSRGTGAVARRGRAVSFPPQLGDLGRDGEVRAFLTFELSGVPAERPSKSARLYVSPQRGGRPLDPRYFSTVWIETVALGSVLTAAAFDAPGRTIERVPLVRLGAAPIDVTDAVRAARDAGEPRLTFRLRFALGGDDDDEADTWIVATSPNTTRLEVDLAP
jgi:hypothetical protein